MGKVTNIKDNFARVPNVWFKDKKLSLKATGLLCFLQSVSDDWDYSVAGIKALFSDQETSISSALKELCDAGYITWKRHRNPDGTMSGNDVMLHLSPKKRNQPICENPKLDKTLTGEIKDNKDKLIIKTNTNKEIIDNTNVLSMAQEPKTEYGNVEINWAFNTFYDMFGYPMKRTARNTHAVWNMLRAKDKGKDWLVQMLNLWYLSRNDKYSPRISDFYELSQKHDKLMEWGQRAALAKQTEVIQ